MAEDFITKQDLADFRADFRAQFVKEATDRAAQWTVGAVIVLLLAAVAGWWLYLKPKIVEIVGGVPSGTIIALDDPGGCGKLGSNWEDANYGGKTIFGAMQGDKKWAYSQQPRGQEEVTLVPANLPPIFLPFRNDLLSGNGFALFSIEGIKFDSNKGKEHVSSNNPAQPFSIMPPYVTLYFCRRKA